MAAVAAAVAAAGIDPVPDFLLLQWHVTHRCDLNCLHCYETGSGVELDIKNSPFMMVLMYYLAMLDTMGPGVCGHIHITGGDPLAHPDIVPMLEQLDRHRARFTYALLCGASRVTPALARILARYRPRYVQLSLDGGPATHDHWRGDGSHHQTVAAMHLLREAGVPVVVAFTCQQENWRELGEVARLAASLGVVRVWADRHIPLGRGELLRDGVMSPGVTRKWVAAMARWSRPWPVLSPHRALQFLAGQGTPYRCQAGRRLLALDPEGVVYPCRRLPLPAGRVGDASLLDVYRHSPVLQALRQDTVPIGCRHCWHRHTCAGGLRCLAHALHGDYRLPDPGCWLTKF